MFYSVAVAALLFLGAQTYNLKNLKNIFKESESYEASDTVNDFRIHVEPKSMRVDHVMSQVDRKHYIPYEPYQDIPMSLGYGAHSTPQQVQRVVLENLKRHLKEGSKALDVGCGTGYLTTCMAIMVGQSGHVVGIDHIKELIDFAKMCVENDKPEFVKEQRISFVEGDGRKGVPDKGPYDVINIGAMSEEIPAPLLEQLKVGGRMMIPLRNISQGLLANVMTIVDKQSDGTIIETEVERFFPDVIANYLGNKDVQLGPRMELD